MNQPSQRDPGIYLLLFIIALGGFGSHAVATLGVAYLLFIATIGLLGTPLLCIMLPFMACYAFMNWRDRKVRERLGDDGYRAYKAQREEAHRRAIDKRLAERVWHNPRKGIRQWIRFGVFLFVCVAVFPLAIVVIHLLGVDRI